ncbi:MAG: hypothetical protein ACUVYA_21365, partial [Planctomycetota bacterium]
APPGIPPVRTTGRYEELVGRELRLAGDPRTFLVRGDALLQRILELRLHGENLAISGTPVPGSDPPAVEVEAVELAPSDAEVFRERRKKIDEATGEERARALQALVEDAAKNHAQYGSEDVLDVVREAAFSLIGALRADAPSDLARALAAFRTLRETLPGSGLGFEFLLKVDSLYPGSEEVAGCFRELRCRRHSGRWVTYEEFKKLEGFVLYEGRWVKPRERHLLESLKAFDQTNPTNLILRHRTEKEYKLLSERGHVELGMRPEEVFRALGPPERVERRLYSGGEFDQWVYGEKYYYFYGGLLVRKP